MADISSRGPEAEKGVTRDIYEKRMRQADKYREEALWEFALVELDAAEHLCQSQEDPEQKRRWQKVLAEKGGNERRQGRYDSAVGLLQQALDLDRKKDLQYAEIIGELGVVYQAKDDFRAAEETFREHFDVSTELARQTHSAADNPSGGERNDEGQTSGRTINIPNARPHIQAWSAKAQQCRAIGNVALALYQQAGQRIREQGRRDEKTEGLLLDAIAKLEQRITLALELQDQLPLPTPFPSLKDQRRQDPESRMRRRAETWHSIALDRLTLCNVAMGNFEAAVETARQSLEMSQRSLDPTVRALSRYYGGYAFFHAGKSAEAKALWEHTTDNDACTSVIALAKEPSSENRRFMEILLDNGVSFTQVDEQGYSALDYAVLSGDAEMEQIVIDGVRGEFRKTGTRAEAESRLAVVLTEAKRRKHYREIFQRSCRPLLIRAGLTRDQRIHSFRDEYSQMLEEVPKGGLENEKNQLFDSFRYIGYHDFMDLGKLPKVHDRESMLGNRIHDFSHRDTIATEKGQKPPFVIFISYRWLGRGAPDDESGTQYHRMKNALEHFLKDEHPELDREQLKLWLDIACIDQADTMYGRRARGLNALPLTVAQCDAMIILLDDQFFTRAWCAVEVLMLQTLQSYGYHEYWEHTLLDPEQDPIGGILRQRDRLDEVQNVGREPERFRLTREQDDRPTVRFLARQSRILAKPLT